MTMLLSIVLTLVSPDGGTLPAEQGRAVYAEVLNRLGFGYPDLATTIHGESGLKPLSNSGLLDQPFDRSHITIHLNQPYSVRVCGLNDEISLALADVFLRRPPQHWRLGHCGFKVTEITCDRNRHPWAGESTYEALVVRNCERHDHRPAMLRTVTLEFYSPTAFTVNEMQLPAPLPGLVFGSLGERWNAFSPVQFDREVRAFAEQHIAISEYELRSRKIPHKNGSSRVGGVGRVTYTVRSNDIYWLAAVQTLADYAFYAGVGVQTAAGMGQCRRV